MTDVLVIDNYDSFTYNLVQYLGELGAGIEVHRNDKISLDQIATMKPRRILISPGPCTPLEAGICVPLIKEFASSIPIFGVCLGHQSIGAAFGAEVVRHTEIMHGKTSEIYHDQQGVFAGIESPFVATRYHSLIIKKESLPPVLKISAWTTAGEIMGVRHTQYPVEGVQFHPESALTEHGRQMIANFLNEKFSG